MKWDDSFQEIFHNIPDHLLTYTGLEDNDPFGLCRIIGEELDRRSPEPLPTQYDSEGNEIKREEIGDGIWLNISV